jgi:hypothetical protein
MSDVTSGSRYSVGDPRYKLIEVKVDQAKLDRITKELRKVPGAMERAIPPALNKTADEMRAVLYREFDRRLAVQRKSSIRSRLRSYPKAGRGNWRSGVRIDLARFALGSFRDVQQTPSGVTWSTGGSPLRGGFVPRAFLRAGLTHYRTGEYQKTRMVFRRAERGDKSFASGRPTRAGGIVRRYPLVVLRGPSLARVFSDDAALQGRVEAEGGRILEKKVQQQADRFTTAATK